MIWENSAKPNFLPRHVMLWLDRIMKNPRVNAVPCQRLVDIKEPQVARLASGKHHSTQQKIQQFEVN